MPVKKKREARLKLVLSEEQLEFLKSGDTDDPEVFLSWGHTRGGEGLRRAFLAVRDDHAPGTFLWAEKEFGVKR